MSHANSDRLKRFETQLDQFFKEALDGIRPVLLSTRTVPDKWSPKENLAHLGRYQEVFQERISQILTGKIPRFSRYRAEEDPEWPQWAQRSTERICAELLASRWVLVERLRNLKKEDFEKTGIHPKFGEMPVSLWLEFFLLHEGHHLYLVFQQVRGG